MPTGRTSTLLRPYSGESDENFLIDDDAIRSFQPGVRAGYRPDGGDVAFRACGEDEHVAERGVCDVDLTLAIESDGAVLAEAGFRAADGPDRRDVAVCGRVK